MKIGVKVVANGRYVTFRLAEVAIPKNFFADILHRIDRPDFEVYLIERPGHWHTLRYDVGLLFGFLPRLGGYRIETGCRIEIKGPPGEPVQCDGDDAAILPLIVELDPTPSSIIVPET